MGIKLQQSFVVHSYHFCSMLIQVNLVGWTKLDLRFCGQIVVHFPPMEVPLDYRRSPLQSPYLQLPGVSTRMNSINTRIFLHHRSQPIRGDALLQVSFLCLSLFLHPHTQHTGCPSPFLSLPTLLPSSPHLSIYHAYFLSPSVRYSLLNLSSPFELDSLNLWIIAWLSCTLRLMSTYK